MICVISIRFVLVNSKLTVADLGSHFDMLPEIQSLPLEIAGERLVTLDCLRLDKLHPFVSGNKWYKLKHHLLQAVAEGRGTVLSFGGAHSNHLHALAFTANQLNLKSIGIVRGEQPETLTPTLEDCKKWGMALHWLDRQSYRDVTHTGAVERYSELFPDAWVIPEGGAGPQGTLGIESLFTSLHHAGKLNYDLIACAVGSGATLAGIAQANIGRAHCVGFSALKGVQDLENLSSLSFWRICKD